MAPCAFPEESLHACLLVLSFPVGYWKLILEKLIIFNDFYQGEK